MDIHRLVTAGRSARRSDSHIATVRCAERLKPGVYVRSWSVSGGAGSPVLSRFVTARGGGEVEGADVEREQVVRCPLSPWQGKARMLLDQET